MHRLPIEAVTKQSKHLLILLMVQRQRRWMTWREVRDQVVREYPPN